MRARFVLDTNIVVSAVLLTKSKARLAFDYAVHRGTLIVSSETIDELYDVLKRDNFNKYVSEAERIEFLAALIRESELIEPDQVIVACRDPRDDKFLSLAVSGSAACIISGDADLKVLDSFQGIPIMSPSEFLARSWDASG